MGTDVRAFGIEQQGVFADDPRETFFDQAQDDYQGHPRHLEFIEKVLKPLGPKVMVYDFE